MANYRITHDSLGQDLGRSGLQDEPVLRDLDTCFVDEGVWSQSKEDIFHRGGVPKFLNILGQSWAADDNGMTDDSWSSTVLEVEEE